MRKLKKIIKKGKRELSFDNKVDMLVLGKIRLNSNKLTIIFE